MIKSFKICYSSFHKCFVFTMGMNVLCQILRIFTGKKHPKIKLQRLRKIRTWTFVLGLEVLRLEQIFKKNKVVTGKTPLVVLVHFVVAILFVLTLASDGADLNGNDVLSILVVPTKKQ